MHLCLCKELRKSVKDEPNSDKDSDEHVSDNEGIH